MADQEKDLYLSCDLTDASADYRAGVEDIGASLRPGNRQPWDSAGPGTDTPREAYLRGISRVADCEAMLAIVDRPSLEVGMKMAAAIHFQKSTLAVARIGRTVTRMVTGAAEAVPSFEFEYYEELDEVAGQFGRFLDRQSAIPARQSAGRPVAKPDQTRGLYVGCALTHAPADFKRGVEDDKAGLRFLGHRILDFVGDLPAEPGKVYDHDIGHVIACQAMLAIVDYESHGLGMEIQTAIHLRKPLFAVARIGREVAGMVPGAAEAVPSFEFHRYADLDQVPAMFDRFLSRHLLSHYGAELGAAG